MMARWLVPRLVFRALLVSMCGDPRQRAPPDMSGSSEISGGVEALHRNGAVVLRMRSLPALAGQRMADPLR